METTTAHLISAAHEGSPSGTRLSREVASGRLLRLRRGVYTPPLQWLRAQPSQRYLMMIGATALQVGDPVFCRESALVLHGVAQLSLPKTVHLRATSRGAVRVQQQTSMTGGLSRSRFLERVTANERDDGAFSSAALRGFATQRHMPLQQTVGCQDLDLDIRLRSRIQESGLRVRSEPLVTALADTLPRLPLADAVIALEAALHSAGESASIRREQIREAGERVLVSRRRQDSLVQLLEFATADSESPGESLLRVRLQELGLAQPRQQVEVVVDGLRYRLDFLWEELGVVLEFDGWLKYRSGFDEARKQEKIREDALRSMGFTVLRVYWEDLHEPGYRRLRRLLFRHGIPRVNQSHSASHRVLHYS